MTTDVKVLAAKIDELLKKSDEVIPHMFDPDEVRELQRVLAFVRRVDALGWWGKWAFYCTVALGTLIVNWDRLVGAFRE